jgi:hypothetical protein
LVPKAVRVAVLVNPAIVPVAEPTLREVQQSRERPDALFVTPDAFFISRRVQIISGGAR